MYNDLIISTYPSQTYLPLGDLLSQIPEEIDKLKNISSIESIASQIEVLPVFSGMGFEYYLSHNKEIDYSLRITKDPLDLLSLGHFLQHFKIHSSIQQFLCNWSRNEAFNIENIWLEFDEKDGEEAKTSVFFDLRDPNRNALLDSEYALKSMNFRSIEMHLNTLRKCLNTFPGFQIHYLGAMLSRENTPLRLTAKGLSSVEVIPVLRDLGWVGNHQRLKSFLECTPGFNVLLDLDLLQEIGSKVGIEFHLSNPDDQLELFEVLMRFDLCTPKQMEVLMNLTTEKQIDAYGELSYRNVGLRLNHLKLVVNRLGELEAKIYLYLCFY